MTGPGSSRSVASAADSGSSRELLVAIRSRVAMAVDDPDTCTRDLAALTKRLVDVAQAIEAIDARDGTPAAPVPDEVFDLSAI